MTDRPNYITPAGFAALRTEYEQLFTEERPKLVETIAWAAGNGDRSENGDYIYGRKRLREIDRRLGWLSKRMKAAKVVDPAQQPDTSRAWFGCTITIADEDDNRRTLTLVGDDETGARIAHGRTAVTAAARLVEQEGTMNPLQLRHQCRCGRGDIHPWDSFGFDRHCERSFPFQKKPSGFGS